MEINLQLSGQNFILFDENIKCQNVALQYAYNCILSVCVRAAVYGEHVFIIRLEPIGREWERHVADLTWGNCGGVLQGLNIRILSLGSIIDQNR